MGPLCLELPAGSQVIGDLHLDVDGEVGASGLAEFARFLEGSGAPVLIILGDLFEYWLGPSHARSEGGRALCELLGAFGGRVLLIPGNRDVLAGSELEACGIELAPEGVLGTLSSGEKLFFLHGDELCIRDTSYLRLRRFLRNPLVRSTLRRLPGFVTRAIARRLRRHSVKATPKKAPLEVTQDAGEASRLLNSVGGDILIVGHAHQFRDEELQGGGRLVVLDAFGGSRDVFCIDEQAQLSFGSSAGGTV